VKRIERRIQASEDLDSTVAYYLDIAGVVLSKRFLDEYNSALIHIATHPGTGSRRYVQLSDGAELRFWTLKRFPYAVFYIDRPDAIEVVRVLHQSSDIPAHLEP